MSVRVHCGCGHAFDADDALAGGLTNCPRCRKATSVPGLNDPAWRWLQVGAAVVVVVAAAATAQAVGVGAGLAVAAGLALLLWLLSRAL